MGSHSHPIPNTPEGAPAITDVGEAPGGHIWDLARKANLSYRNYGFYVSEGLNQGKSVIIPENYPTAVGLAPGGHDLAGITDLDFLGFDLNYSDSEAPLRYSQKFSDKDVPSSPRATFGLHDAPSRFAEWHREFEEMLDKSPDGSAVPNFHDHPLRRRSHDGHQSEQSLPEIDGGRQRLRLRPARRRHQPQPDRKSTAIFIIEDDAQNGPDHVDAHRSVCYVISPCIKAHSVDHTFQNTASCLRTMELLLGLAAHVPIRCRQRSDHGLGHVADQ